MNLIEIVHVFSNLFKDCFSVYKTLIPRKPFLLTKEHTYMRTYIHTIIKRKQMFSSVNTCVFVVVVVLVISLIHMYTSISLVRSSLLVTEQASSCNNTCNKEIAFISFDGNHLNDNKPIATTQNTHENATTVTATTSEPARILKRGKRYLDFLNTSRLFFRVNVKNNIVPKSVIWAHGYGFRCNFPIENDKSVRPFRRDTYEALEDLMNKSGFDGKACILKAFCVAHMDEYVDMRKGMLFKLLKYIFTLNDEDKKHFPYLKHQNCHQILHSHCPLSFNNISPFTDDV